MIIWNSEILCLEILYLSYYQLLVSFILANLSYFLLHAQIRVGE